MLLMKTSLLLPLYKYVYRTINNVYLRFRVVGPSVYSHLPSRSEPFRQPGFVGRVPVPAVDLPDEYRRLNGIGTPWRFWATVCKTVRPMLSDRCLSVPSVTLVYCGQTVGWIKMPFGMEVGLDPGDIVLDAI